MPTEAGYPAGLTDSSKFNPLTALISYIPRDFHSSPVQSWHVSVQREFGPHMLVDVAYVGNKATTCCWSANYNQAAPNNAAGTIPLAARRPIPTCGDITYVFNGGKSRYDAFQMKYEWRMGADVNILSSLTLSKAKDNAAGALENQNGNFPAPQDINNLDADYGLSAYHQPYNSTTSFVWSLPFGNGKRWGSGMSAAMDLLAGGWQVAGINTITPGEMVTLHLHAGGRRSRSRGSPTTSPAPTTTGRTSPAIRTRPSQQSITNWFNPACVVAADRSEPAVRQRAAQQRPRTELLAVRSRGEQERSRSATGPSCSSASRRSTCSTA